MSGAMLHGPCDIVGQLLLDQNVVTDPTDNGIWPLGVSEELASPDEVVSIFDTQGKLEGSENTEGEIQEQEGLLLRVRAKDYRTGYAKAKALATLFDQSISNNVVTLETSVYLVGSVNRTSGIIHAGKETGASKRHLFTINFTVALTQRS